VNDDFDRYDLAMALLCGVLIDGALVEGVLWAVVPIMLVGCLIGLYRHLPLPPRRR
jgi:hypothetical protein